MHNRRLGGRLSIDGMVLALLVATAATSIWFAPVSAAAPPGHVLCCDNQPIGPTSCTTVNHFAPCSSVEDCAHWFAEDNMCCSWFTPEPGQTCRQAANY